MFFPRLLEFLVRFAPMAPAHREHNCIHEHLGEPVEPRRRTRQLYEAGEGGPPPEKSGPDEGDGDASGMQPLRIVINTDALRSDPGYTCFRVGEFVNGQPCRQEQVLTPVKRSTLEESLMPRAAAFFSKALSVKRVVGNLRCGLVHTSLPAGGISPTISLRTGSAPFVAALAAAWRFPRVVLRPPAATERRRFRAPCAVSRCRASMPPPASRAPKPRR